MNVFWLKERMWGSKARYSYLLVAAVLLLFSFLGARDIWTQEHRWADIVHGMFVRNDFLHPYLGENTYYDKPLLSYWLIALVAQVSGYLDAWSLRIPSALAALLAVYSIYRLGTQIKNKSMGLLAGWLLITTYYFLFWGRTSSADMLNLAGSTFAVAWYYDKRNTATLFDYSIFFIILALTSLCKGPIGAVVTLIAVGVEVLVSNTIKQHLTWKLLFALIPGIIIFLFPFLASSYFGGENYGQNGLYLVYKENILRYVQPFDHKGPIYTYLLYLPIYLLPWAIFFIPAFLSLPFRWKNLSTQSKWLAWTLFALFLFFTLSGSRRSYYVLAMVPFGILFVADWILEASNGKRQSYAAIGILIAYVGLFLLLSAIPGWFYSHYGVKKFSQDLQSEVTKIQPWQTWNVIMLDAESKINFYLKLKPQVTSYHIKGITRAQQTAESILQAFPILLNKPDNTIFITRKKYQEMLAPYFHDYKMMEGASLQQFPILRAQELNLPIAYIPIKS